jgi:hypothetical protein
LEHGESQIDPLVAEALLVFQGSFLRSEQEYNSSRHRDTAIDRPANLAGHEAAWQNVDALQEPDCAEQRQCRTQDPQDDSHVLAMTAMQVRTLVNCREPIPVHPTIQLVQ